MHTHQMVRSKLSQTKSRQMAFAFKVSEEMAIRFQLEANAYQMELMKKS